MNKRSVYLKYPKRILLTISFLLVNHTLYAVRLPIYFIKPSRTVIIKGRITDRVTGRPLVAAIRILDVTSNQSGFAQSDKSGNYSAVTYPRRYNSLYKITGQRPGYQTVIRQINVRMGNTYTVDFQLTDNVPPIIRITRPQDNSYINRTSILVRGTVNETAVVTVNNINANVTNNRFSANNVPLPNEGANRITVTAVDLTGNRSARQITVIRDTITPQIDITIPEDGSTVIGY